jgi:hypothetical protein
MRRCKGAIWPRWKGAATASRPAATPPGGSHSTRPTAPNNSAGRVAARRIQAGRSQIGVGSQAPAQERTLLDHPGADRPAAGAAGRLQPVLHPAGPQLRLPRPPGPATQPGPGAVHRRRQPPGPALVGIHHEGGPARPGRGAGVGTLADADPTVLALATAIGLLAAPVQFLGLVRWPFAVPLADPPPTRRPPGTRDAVAVVFQTSTATSAWPSVTSWVAVHRAVDRPGWGRPPPVRPVAPAVRGRRGGAGAAGGVGVAGVGWAFEPGGWQLAGALVPLADIGWSIWLLTLGSRRRGMERPLGPLQLMDRGQPPVGSHGRFGH